MVIQACEQVTPAWLTEVLMAKGGVQHGRVMAIECDTQAFNQGYVSNVAALSITYSADASGTLPSRLFLKMSRPGVHAELLDVGRREVAFYQVMEDVADDFPIPRCYDAASDDSTGQVHVLMDDLSATHFQRPLPIPPSHRHCEMIMESLAHLHAWWWNSPRLGTKLGERLDERKAAEIRRRLEDTLPTFIDYLGDALLPTQRKAYEQIMASPFWARRVERLCSLQGVTLIHGDAHTGNFMLPHDTARHKVMLIDWHLCDINTAAIDLAFLMALHWSPQRRAVLERPLVRHYYGNLMAHGVTNYSWDDLWRDYREAVIIMTLIPIGQFRRNMPAGVIWFGLQDSMAAFQDLNCAELL